MSSPGPLGALLSGPRLGKFASAGFVGASVDTAVLFGLVEFAGLSPVVAKVVSWEVAIVVIFAINERWTFSGFGSSDPRRLAGRFLRSNLVRLGGFVVTLGVLGALVYGVGVWYLVANAAGIGVGFVVNYAAENLYTWRVQYDSR